MDNKWSSARAGGVNRGRRVRRCGSDICVATATHAKLHRGSQVVDFKQRWGSFSPGKKQSKNGKSKTFSVPLMLFLMRLHCLLFVCLPADMTTKPLSPHRPNSSPRFRLMVSVFIQFNGPCHFLSSALECIKKSNWGKKSWIEVGPSLVLLVL